MSGYHTKIKLYEHDALIIADVQNDFLAGGNLVVPYGDEILPILNRYILLFRNKGLPVFASREWHPSNHCSFDTQGGAWPVHCVKNSYGAQISVRLKLAPDTVIISKASQPDLDSYSAFEGSELLTRLHERSVSRLFIGGFATEYCVFDTVKDARSAGFTVRVLSDAVRAFDIHPGDGDRALEDMSRLGATFAELKEAVV